MYPKIKVILRFQNCSVGISHSAKCENPKSRKKKIKNENIQPTKGSFSKIAFQSSPNCTE